ncbi:MAG: hypothetical protein ACYCWW_08335 [Deltaproteobacteria bacterium]
MRRLLGAIRIDVAQRKRICHHDRKHHSIEKGAMCLVIKETSGEGQKNYCAACGLEILDQAADDLASLRSSLE